MENIRGDDCYRKLDNKGYILYYFTASWCKPCQLILNDVNKLSEEYSPVVTFFKVDISDEENNEICETCKVKSIPSFLLFKDRNYIDRVSGSNIQKVINMFHKLKINLIITKDN